MVLVERQRSTSTTGRFIRGKEKTVDDLVKAARPGRVTKGRTIQYELSGGMNRAVKDFYSLRPKIIKDTSDLKVGILEDGRTVIVNVLQNA